MIFSATGNRCADRGRSEMKVFPLIVGLLAIVFTPFVLCDSIEALRLTEKSLESPNYVIPVSQSDVSALAGERDYYTLLIITSTDPAHNCEVCQSLNKVIDRVADSWFADYANSNYLFFVNIDLADHSNAKLFHKVNIDTVPHIWLLPPSRDKPAVPYDEAGFSIFKEPHFIFRLPMTGLDSQIYELALFLTQQTHKSIYIRHENPVQKFVTTFALTLGAIIFIRKRGPRVISNFQKKDTVKILALVCTLVFVGGYLFSTIEKAPFVAKNDVGEVIYISGGIYYQFGIEVFIIAANYALLGASLICLIYLGTYKVTAVSRISSENGKNLCIGINTIITYLLYSLLTSIFLRKDHEYPYHFSKLL